MNIGCVTMHLFASNWKIGKNIGVLFTFCNNNKMLQSSINLQTPKCMVTVFITSTTTIWIGLLFVLSVKEVYCLAMEKWKHFFRTAKLSKSKTAKHSLSVCILRSLCDKCTMLLCAFKSMTTWTIWLGLCSSRLT